MEENEVKPPLGGKGAKDSEDCGIEESFVAETYFSDDASLGYKEEGSFSFDEAVRYYQHVLICFHLYKLIAPLSSENELM